MRLRNVMLRRRITHRPLLRAKSALTGDAALELLADFFATALLERIGASARKDGKGKQNRQWLHRRMIESKGADARGRLNP